MNSLAFTRGKLGCTSCALYVAPVLGVLGMGEIYVLCRNLIRHGNIRKEPEIDGMIYLSRPQMGFEPLKELG